MRSLAPAEFWSHYTRLPVPIQVLARRTFAIFKRDPFHPSLHFKPVAGDVWSVRVGRNYHALARRRPDAWLWFWIGSHEDYNKLLRRV